MTSLIPPFFPPDPFLWLGQASKAGFGGQLGGRKSFFVVGTITVSWLRGFVRQLLTVSRWGFMVSFAARL